MVLEIRLSNFFSIKDEVVIDFRAANIKSKNARELSDNIFKQNKNELLKTLLVYGANASGKSNIIKAIRFCHAMVFNSHNHNENTIFNFKSFKFDGMNKKPSTYFIRFIMEGIEYEYSFSLFQDRIVKESLHYYPKGRIKEVFSRDETRGKTKQEKYNFTDVIRRPMDVAENTSDKTLYISRASQMDRAIAKDVFNYFHKTFILNYLGYSVSALRTITEENKAFLLEALQIADSDIVDLQIKVLKEPVKSVSADLSTKTVEIEDTLADYLQIKTFHRNHPGVAFDFLTEESQGTIKMFFIMMTLLHIIKANKVLLIDEIEESLHPKIIDYIFNLFKAGNKAQLLCTTHNTQFLDLKKFRKDQIYFVNKKEDGSSDLYSLYDYSDFRDTMDLEKAYLQGRFDAIPIVDGSINDLKHLIYE